MKDKNNLQEGQIYQLETQLKADEQLIRSLIEDVEALDDLVSPKAYHVVKSLRPIAVADDVYSGIEEEKTFGDKLSDSIAKRAGSWGFIISFMLLMSIWIGINIIMQQAAFDPYPFILLNLGLSTLAALQAPVILMSQNRQAEVDRAMSVSPQNSVV